MKENQRRFEAGDRVRFLSNVETDDSDWHTMVWPRQVSLEATAGSVGTIISLDEIQAMCRRGRHFDEELFLTYKRRMEQCLEYRVRLEKVIVPRRSVPPRRITCKAGDVASFWPMYLQKLNHLAPGVFFTLEAVDFSATGVPFTAEAGSRLLRIDVALENEGRAPLALAPAPEIGLTLQPRPDPADPTHQPRSLHVEWAAGNLPGNGGKVTGWALFQVPTTNTTYHFKLHLPSVGQAATLIYWLRRQAGERVRVNQDIADEMVQSNLAPQYRTPVGPGQLKLQAACGTTGQIVSIEEYIEFHRQQIYPRLLPFLQKDYAHRTTNLRHFLETSDAYPVLLDQVPPSSDPHAVVISQPGHIELIDTVFLEKTGEA
jgi:hypothetical protein